MALDNILMDYSSLIDDLLSKPYWIIDILPKQVPADNGGQYFKIERFFLSPSKMEMVNQKFANLLLKFNCYYDIMVCCKDEWSDNPEPEILEQWIKDKKQLHVVIISAKTMIAISGEDHYMTLYNPDDDTLSLIQTLAASEGLFVWTPDNQDN